MPENNCKFIWRCLKCSSHFANITKADGLLKEEKKCPKCKSLNMLTLASKEIIVHCKLYDPDTNGYTDDRPSEFVYPEPEN